MENNFIKKDPLMLGIMLDSYESQAWLHKLLSSINSSPHIKLSLIIKNGCEKKKDSALRRVLAKMKVEKLLLSVYRQLDRRLNIRKDPFVKMDLESVLNNIPSLELAPRQTKFCHYFSKSDGDKVRKYQLDVVLRFGFRIIKGDIFNVARYGVWSLHHGDAYVNRGGPAGFWETYFKHPIVGVTLQKINEELDGGDIIDQAFCSASESSWQDSIEGLYWNSVALVLKNLNIVHLKRKDPAYKRSKPYCKPLYRAPSVIPVLRLIGRLFLQLLKNNLRKWFYYNEWSISLASSKDRLVEPLYRYKSIRNPNNSYLADPFLVNHLGKSYIFVEEYIMPYKFSKSGKGVISIIPIENGIVSKCVPFQVLKENYHLSYPLVFSHNDIMYMIPESGENKSIDLYQAVSFPHKWSKVNTLCSGEKFVDATPFYHENRWWLFVCKPAHEGLGCNDQLWIYYADHLHEDHWASHEMNPVVIDIRGARSAGKIFKEGGKIIRPAQNCSKGYGHTINFYEIKDLTPKVYRQIFQYDISPDWQKGLCGVHTYNADKNYQVIDKHQRRFRWLC